MTEATMQHPVIDDFPYVYRWDRQGRKGQFCKVLARGTMNSCLVEFEDGYRMVTSRNAIRKRRAPEGRLSAKLPARQSNRGSQ